MPTAEEVERERKTQLADALRSLTRNVFYEDDFELGRETWCNLDVRTNIPIQGVNKTIAIQAKVSDTDQQQIEDYRFSLSYDMIGMLAGDVEEQVENLDNPNWTKSLQLNNKSGTNSFATIDFRWRVF